MFEGPEKNLEVVFRKINDQQIDSSVGELGNDCWTHSPRRIAPTRSRRLGPHLRPCPLHHLVFHLRYLRCLRPFPSRRSSSIQCLFSRLVERLLCFGCVTTLIDLGRKLRYGWAVGTVRHYFPGDQAFPHQSFHQGRLLRTSQSISTARRKRLHSWTSQWRSLVCLVADHTLRSGVFGD
jgi:hypothetical protein